MVAVVVVDPTISNAA